MNAAEHLSRIEELLIELKSSRNLGEAETILKSINRSANYLSGTDKNIYSALSLLCSDLAELIRGEKLLVQTTQQKPQLGEGFFKSFSVLHAEFKKTIADIRG